MLSDKENKAFDFIVDNGICSEEALKLAGYLNGFTMETFNKVIYIDKEPLCTVSIKANIDGYRKNGNECYYYENKIDNNIKYQTKPNYIRRKVAGNDILIPVAENVADFNGFIELNSAAAFIWDFLKA